MTPTKRRLSGFTIVEIVIVVTILAILTAIGSFTVVRLQADSRDKSRESSVGSIAEALERYYDKNGEYPGVSLLTGDAQTAAMTLGNIDKTVLVAPRASDSTENSIIAEDIENQPGVDAYAYVAECETDTTCNRWTLQYREETTGQINTIESRRDVAATLPEPEPEDPITPDDPVADYIPAPDAPRVSADYSSPDNVIGSIELGSACESGNPQYKLRSRVNSGAWSSWSGWGGAGATKTITAAGATTYGFQAIARCVDGLTLSDDSPIADEVEYYHPSDAYSPGVTAKIVDTTAVGTSSIVTCDDGSTPNYQLHSRINGGTWSDWSDWSTGRSLSVPGAQGSKHEFQGRARCGDTGTPSADSNIAPVTYPLLAPTKPVITTAITGKNIRGTVSVVTCPAGSTAEYRMQVRYNANKMGSYNAWSISRVRDMKSYYGARHSFRAQARCVNALTTGAAVTTDIKDYVRTFLKLKEVGGVLSWNASTDKYYWSTPWSFSHIAPTSGMSVNYGVYQCRKHKRGGSWGVWSSDWSGSATNDGFSKCGYFTCSKYDYFQTRYTFVRAKSTYSTGPSIVPSSNAAKCTQ